MFFRQLNLHVHLHASCTITVSANSFTCVNSIKLSCIWSSQCSQWSPWRDSADPLIDICFKASWAALQPLYSNCTREICTEHNGSLDNWGHMQIPEFGWLSRVQTLSVMRTGFIHTKECILIILWWNWEYPLTLCCTFIQSETVCFLRILVTETLAKLGLEEFKM